MPTERMRERADEVLPTAVMIATSSYTSIGEHFTWLRDANPAHWDFYVTVAGVHYAAMLLQTHRPEEEYEPLLLRIIRHLKDWSDLGERALLDCNRYTERVEGEPMIAHGLWVLWNVLNRRPESSEALAAASIGLLIRDAFRDWWFDITPPPT